MAADALSDLLRTVRLTGAAFFDVAAKEPWVAESASAGYDPVEDLARCRSSDRVSCGHSGPVLR